MSSDEWRRPFPKGESLERVLGTLEPGTGVSVVRFPPYWDVVARRRAGTIGATEFIVTDSSRPGRKPLVVHGPVRKQDAAEKWAREVAQLWRSTHVFFATDEPEWLSG